MKPGEYVVKIINGGAIEGYVIDVTEHENNYYAVCQSKDGTKDFMVVRPIGKKQAPLVSEKRQ